MEDIPLRPENFRILHPEIIHKTGQVLQKYTLKQGNVSFNLTCFSMFNSLWASRDTPSHCALAFFAVRLNTRLHANIREKES